MIHVVIIINFATCTLYKKQSESSDTLITYCVRSGLSVVLCSGDFLQTLRTNLLFFYLRI